MASRDGKGGDTQTHRPSLRTTETSVPPGWRRPSRGRGMDQGPRADAFPSLQPAVPRPVSGGHTCSLPHSAGCVPSCNPGQRCWPPGAFVHRDSEPCTCRGHWRSEQQRQLPAAPLPAVPDPCPPGLLFRSRCHPSCPRLPDSRDAVMLLEKAGRVQPSSCQRH